MAKEICEILILDQKNDDEQRCVGRVILDGKTLSVEANTADWAPGMKRILESEITVDGENFISSKEHPELWFHSLPKMYSGTYMRAKILP